MTTTTPTRRSATEHAAHVVQIPEVLDRFQRVLCAAYGALTASPKRGVRGFVPVQPSPVTPLPAAAERARCCSARCMR